MLRPCQTNRKPKPQALRRRGRLDRLPPQSFFLVSAIFHYLGPSLAVLLFARIDVLGVAWLRIASAAVVFALWRRPWRLIGRLGTGERWNLLALGLVLAVMNSAFYLAVDRLPLSTVGAIEFLGTVILAAAGARTAAQHRSPGAHHGGRGHHHLDPHHRPAARLRLRLRQLRAVHAVHRARPPDGQRRRPGRRAGRPASIDRLAGAMVIAAVIATPWGLGGALPAFGHPIWLLAGAGVGVCSSVIPYVTDQLAMARLPRATFSLMLALLPVFATVIGAIVLRQIPTVQDAAGITLVVLGVAIHQQERKQRGIRTAGIGRAEGIPDLPGHDELRQPGRTRLAP